MYGTCFCAVSKAEEVRQTGVAGERDVMSTLVSQLGRILVDMEQCSP